MLCFLLFLSLILLPSTIGLSIPPRKRPRIPVLQYHSNWVCVDKPYRLTVHHSKGTPKRKAVLTTSTKRQLARKVFSVNRLDHRPLGGVVSL
jgi:23S rRNA-/tRNA-specific pseudouridylate synthase